MIVLHVQLYWYVFRCYSEFKADRYCSVVNNMLVGLFFSYRWKYWESKRYDPRRSKMHLSTTVWIHEMHRHQPWCKCKGLSRNLCMQVSDSLINKRNQAGKSTYGHSKLVHRYMFTCSFWVSQHFLINVASRQCIVTQCTAEFLRENKVKVIEHPPYLPDLVMWFLVVLYGKETLTDVVDVSRLKIRQMKQFTYFFKAFQRT